MRKLNVKKSRYVTKQEAGDGLVVTIADFKEESVSPVGAEPDVRWVVYCSDAKPWTLIPSRHEECCEIFGTDDVDRWIGKQVELYHNPRINNPQGQRVGGLRVRRVGSVPKNVANTAREAEPDLEGPEEDIPF